MHRADFELRFSLTTGYPWLLRARRERSRGNSAAWHCYELAPPQSIEMHLPPQPGAPWHHSGLARISQGSDQQSYSANGLSSESREAYLTFRIMEAQRQQGARHIRIEAPAAVPDPIAGARLPGSILAGAPSADGGASKILGPRFRGDDRRRRSASVEPLCFLLRERALIASGSRGAGRVFIEHFENGATLVDFFGHPTTAGALTS